jgi:multimeric flavodoxin WrbA
MTVRLLGLNCSPRDNSNSSIMLETAFEKLDATYPGEAEHEIVHLRDLAIEPCKACNVCGKTKDGKFIPCVRVDEDDVQVVLDQMVAADGLLVATPVYFGLPTDLFSRFIMRTRPLRHQDFKLANRPVGVMATAGRRSGGARPPGCPSCATAASWWATATARASSAPTGGPVGAGTSAVTSGVSNRPSRRRSACSR